MKSGYLNFHAYKLQFYLCRTKTWQSAKQVLWKVNTLVRTIFIYCKMKTWKVKVAGKIYKIKQKRVIVVFDVTHESNASDHDCLRFQLRALLTHYVCVKMLSKGVNSPAELWGWHSAKGWSAQRGFSVITQWRIAGKWSETRRGALIRAHSLCINLSPPNTHLRKRACTIVGTRAEERVSGGCVTRHT